ncbi:hypothetical protein [Bosea sp. (in: a-proteobacteria)]|uniref:hypothetical protein n=1 Tax=Bosea sp. (in: a-proteobacteria) TaxID=1871050 RepID=UPI0035678423
MSSHLVRCATHGSDTAAFVCSHLVETLRDGVARGVFWSRDEDGCINAYCSRCADAIDDNGGELTSDIETKFDIQLICEACFTKIAHSNGLREFN